MTTLYEKQKRILQTYIIIATIGSLLPTLFCIKSYNELQNIENEKSVQENELLEISVEKEELLTEINELTQLQLDLHQSKQQYEKDINLLKTEKLTVQNAIHTMYDTLDDLKTNKSELESNIEQLSIEKETLSDELQTIANKIDVINFSNNVPLVHKDGNVDDSYILYVYNELALLPKFITDLYQRKGVRIYVTTKNIANDILNGNYKSVMGVTIYDTDTIYIEDRKEACENSTLHECGHLFNLYNEWAMSTDEWQAIYAKESSAFGQLAGSYCISNLDECFAEAFALYFKNSKALLSSCPDMYEYMQNLIERLE